MGKRRCRGEKVSATERRGVAGVAGAAGGASLRAGAGRSGGRAAGGAAGGVVGAGVAAGAGALAAGGGVSGAVPQPPEVGGPCWARASEFAESRASKQPKDKDVERTGVSSRGSSL